MQLCYWHEPATMPSLLTCSQKLLLQDKDLNIHTAGQTGALLPSPELPSPPTHVNHSSAFSAILPVTNCLGHARHVPSLRQDRTGTD